MDKDKTREFDPKILREVHLYNQTLKAAQLALAELKKESLPIFRPDDFYAETIKSDKQLIKIQERIKSTETRRELLAKKRQ